MRIVKKGATSQTLYVVAMNSSTGAPLTGLVYNTSSLIAYYVLNAGSATSITLATLAAANSAYSSGGFKEVDATNMPGLYRFDPPNAALTGADSVVFVLSGAANLAQISEEVQLTAVDAQDTIRMGLTAMPSATSGSAGALLTSGTGTAQLSVTSGVALANATQFAGQTITAGAGVTLPATVASTTNITAGTITTVTNLTNAPGAGDFTATMKTSLATAMNAALDAAMTEVASDPGATPSIRQGTQLLYMALRNKFTNTATVQSIFNDAGVAIMANTVSDDGTVYTKNKFA